MIAVEVFLAAKPCCVSSLHHPPVELSRCLSMMLSGESPSMLFDLVMTRFEDSYNPTVIYDASCLAKEYGLNRELRRFIRIKICSDRFHQCNHTTCCDSFKSSEYGSLLKINTEAAEQTNSVLRRTTTSTTYMSPMIYLRSLKLFFAFCFQ